MLDSLKVDLAEHTALVTGASQGLGKAIAIAFGRAGARVACVARNADKLAEATRQIHEAGGRGEAFSVDVNRREEIDSVVDKLAEEWGKIDILVNNAGITRDTLMLRMTDAQWDEVIATNLTGAFLFARAVARHMLSARYGRIINMSSVSGAVIGNPGQANYAASKAGMVGLTRSLSKELAKRKITVNAIAPGFIESDMTEALGEKIIGEVKKQIPANRLGTAADVAASALFLASPAAAYITGQVLVVDGGMTG